MQGSVPLDPAAVYVRSPRCRGEPFWIILAGGLIVALGVLFESAGTFAEALGSIGVTPLGFFQWIAFESLGYAAEATGFLLAFVGIALGLYTSPPAAPRAIGRNPVLAILLGGLMVAAARVPLEILTASSFANGPQYYLQPPVWVYGAATIVEAAGFLVASLGIAMAFRAKGRSS